MATLMAMEATHDVAGMSNNALNLKHLIGLIQKNRCRKLKGDDIQNIFKDIEEEVLLSQAVYKMDQEDKITKARLFRSFF